MHRTPGGFESSRWLPAVACGPSGRRAIQAVSRAIRALWQRAPVWAMAFGIMSAIHLTQWDYPYAPWAVVTLKIGYAVCFVDAVVSGTRRCRSRPR